MLDIFLFHTCDIGKPCGNLPDLQVIYAGAATSRHEIHLLTGSRAWATAGGRSREIIKVGS